MRTVDIIKEEVALSQLVNFAKVEPVLLFADDGQTFALRLETKLWDDVRREPLIIHRHGFDDVALISAAELSSLIETAYLLRSSKNGKRLLKALHRAKTEVIAPQTISELRYEVGLEAN